jgi:flagellar motor switch protein FliM
MPDVPANPVSVLPDSAGSRPADRVRNIAPYDFRHPTQLSREHVRMLQIAYETFARRLTTLLTSGLRQVCQVTVADITQQSYEAYVTGLANQTLIAPMTLPPLAGTAVLEFSLPTALAAIDHMLGGPGGAQPPRPLTDIETTLIRSLLEQMLGVLSYSFEPIVPVTPALGVIEYNPQFVQAATATDAVVVTTFDMTIGTERCLASLCLPLASLLPRLTTVRQRADGNAPSREALEATARLLRDRLGEVPVEVSVEFLPVDLTPARILTLTEGDVVPFAHRVGVPLTVQAGGIRFAQAVAGRSGNRLAALIVDSPNRNKEFV